MSHDKKLPATKAGLEVSPVEDGYVVYDAETDKIHYLNQTSAVVFDCCDVGTTYHQAAGLLEEAYQLPVRPIEAVISAVDQLAQAGIVG